MLRKILYKLKYKFDYFFENIIFNDRILYLKKKKLIISFLIATIIGIKLQKI